MDDDPARRARLRAAFAKLPRTDRIDRMLAEQLRGVPKERSVAVITDEDARTWDLMAAEATPPGRVIEFALGREW